MKKALSLLLVLLMVVTMLPAAALATEGEEVLETIAEELPAEEEILAAEEEVIEEAPAEELIDEAPVEEVVEAAPAEEAVEEVIEEVVEEAPAEAAPAEEIAEETEDLEELEYLHEMKWANTNVPEVETVACTEWGKSDGKITGVSDEMEYRKFGDNKWISVAKNADVLTGLKAGMYEVRFEETQHHYASNSVKVIVKNGAPAAPQLTDVKPCMPAEEGVELGSFKIADYNSKLKYEYALEGTDDWTDAKVSQSGKVKLDAGSYKVRVKETEYYVAGKSAVVEIYPAIEAVEITGEAKYGSTLTAALVDYNGSKDETITYQWYYVGHNEHKILGANTATLVLDNANWIDTYAVKVVVTVADRGGEASATTEVITKADGPEAPVVEVTHCTDENSTDGIIYAADLYKMEYRVKGTEEWTKVGLHFHLRDLEKGTYELRYVETKTAFAGEIAEVEVFESIEQPVEVSGKSLVGETLTATLGAYDGEGELQYQWFTKDGKKAGVAIKGANEATYKLTDAELGLAVYVEVTATDRGGVSVGHAQEIVRKSLTHKDIKVLFEEGISCYILLKNGTEPKFTVADGEEKTLVWEKDYTVEFKDNTKAGTGTLVVTGKDLYVDSVSVPFVIKTMEELATPKTFAAFVVKEAKEDIVLTIGEGTDLDADCVTKVTVDGIKVSDEQVVVEDGCVKVTVTKAFLNTLAVGEHKLVVEMTYAREKFTIERTIVVNAPAAPAKPQKPAKAASAKAPKTGDEAQLGLWIALMSTSILALGAVVLFKKRKQN